MTIETSGAVRHPLVVAALRPSTAAGAEPGAPTMTVAPAGVAQLAEQPPCKR